MKVIDKLIPVLSEKEKQEMLSYFTVYEKYEVELARKGAEDLKDHPAYGKFILEIPMEVTALKTEITNKLKRDAILHNNWRPYVEYQVQQGILYAKMGLDFKSWYEVVTLVKSYIVPYLHQEYGNGTELISALNGMNNFMDIVMRIVGEAYMQEKNETIKQANDRLSSIFETTADAIYVLEVEPNKKYRFSSVNKSFQLFTGITGDKLLGKYLHEIVPKSSLKICLEKYNEAIHERKVVRWEIDTLYPSGQIQAIASISPLFNEYGNCIRLVGAFHDISERLKSEHKIKKLNEELEQKVIERTAELESKIQQLRESEEKFEKAFHASAAGISISDLEDSSFLDVNDAFVKITGYSKEELITRTEKEPGLIISDERREEIKEQVRECGSLRNFELSIRNKSGNIVEVLSSIETILLKGKKYAIAIIYDITERKRAEEQLGYLNKELEAFAYSVSHDLRVPLRAVNGYARMLNDDFGTRLNGDGKRVLEAISYNAAKMGTLIDDLLAFSRLGRKEIQKTEVDMNDLVKSVIAEISKSMKHSAKIKINKLPKVNVDYGLVYQVVFNLVSNAVKYSSKKEEPVVEIYSEERSDETIFSIKDNGAGFDMKYSDKLFGVFQRLHTEDEFEGTGVGLAIVQRVVNKHGGKVWALGQVNEGAVFNFSLAKK